MRSSPIVCLVDAIEVLFLLAYYTLRGNWPRKAAQLVAKYRFQDFDETKDGFASVERNKYVRLVIFVLGALPQAVKLYVLTGVPWTKAWGSMYLVSFVFVELVVVMAGYEEKAPNQIAAEAHDEQRPNGGESDNRENQEPNRGETVIGGQGALEVESCGGKPAPRKTTVRMLKPWMQHQHFHGLLAAWFQAMLCVWALDSAISGALTNDQVSNSSKTAAKALAITLSPLYLASATWFYASVCFALSFAGAVTIPVGVAVGMHAVSHAHLVGLPTFGGGYFTIFLTHFLILQSLLYYWVRNNTEPMVLPVRLFFFFANILAALLYYCFKYNPKGTSKPLWIDVLG